MESFNQSGVSEVARRSFTQARARRLQGDVKGCISAISDCIGARISQHDKAELLLERGRAHVIEAKYASAGADFATALEIASQSGIRQLQLDAQYHIAMVLFLQKDNDGAAQVLVPALRSAEEMRETRIVAQCSGLLGEIAVVNKDLGRARGLLSSALASYTQLNDNWGIGEQKSNLGRLCINTREYDHAIALFNESLSIFRSTGDPNEMAKQYINLSGTYLNLGKIDLSLKHAHEALAVLEDINNWTLRATVQEIIAYVFQYRRHDRAQAIHWYRLAAESIEEVRSQLAGTADHLQIYFSGLYEVYRELIELLCQDYLDTRRPELLEEIFRCVEHSKAYTLASRLTNAAAGGESDPREEELKAVLQITESAVMNAVEQPGTSELAELQRRSMDAQSAYSSFRLQKALRRGTKEREMPEIAELGRFQNEVLRDDEIFISYYVTMHNAYCVVVDKSRAELLRLCDFDNFTKAYKDYADALGSALRHGGPANDSAFKKTWQLLVPGELFHNIAGKAAVLVSPDHRIGAISFELCASSALSGHLIPNMIYQPSGSVLAQQRRAAQYSFGGSFVGIADPQINSASFPRLPRARKEIQEAFDAAPGDACDPLIGESATRSAFLELVKEPCRCVHIACHAVASDKRLHIIDPAIVLRSTEGAFPDLLHERDIFDMAIRARLVILSACSTGEGEFQWGEGTASLARSFIAAGARAVIFSFWPVADESAREYMQHFYALARSNPVGVALSLARNSVAAIRHCPLDWCSFSIMGDARSRLWE